MRKLVFLYPKKSMQQGGHTAQIAIQHTVNKYTQTKMVTYQEKSIGTDYLDDILEDLKNNSRNIICIIHWGPHIKQLIKRLKGLAIVYISHSTNWSFSLPKNIPIITVSKHCQAYWGKHAQSNPIFYLPNIIHKQFHNSHKPRKHDILVIKRKTSSYVLNELIPLLEHRCKIQIIDKWVYNMGDYMRDSYTFIYDSNEHFLSKKVAEGFGLPPLEAIACGCHVFSSLNDALSDYLEPGINCQQIRVHSAKFDAIRILNTINMRRHNPDTESFIHPWRENQVSEKTEYILSSINDFFDLYGTDTSNNTGPLKKLKTLFNKWQTTY